MKGSYDAARMTIWAEILNSILRHERLSYREIAVMHAVSPASVFRVATRNKVVRKTGRKKTSSQ